ncbi:AAA family ATPase [Gordonia sp. DT30]|uniref:AAA family ATPase n=1 Tax=Gordonia sp. DT30 TaxID=3416546 RepID=UPI003CF731E9
MTSEGISDDRAAELSVLSFQARYLADHGFTVTPPAELADTDQLALESPTVRAMAERLAANDRARQLVEAQKSRQAILDGTFTDLLVDGHKFLTDEPEGVESFWGAGDNVLWAAGESLIIAGPQGVGKTTTAGNLVRGMISDEVAELWGLPVRCAQRVLYLAMDRPRQLARSIRRQLHEVDPEILRGRLVVWKGPPPHDLARHPALLTEMAERAEADVVVVDSLKDAAIGLSDDEVGAGWNRARQQLLVTGRQIAELHHLKKVTRERGDKGPPVDIDTLYGSTWLTSGAGSVLLLSGNPGDPIVTARHLKQPVNEIGPLTLVHNADGSTEVRRGAELLTLARGGLTARAAAQAMFETERPSRAQVEKARRKLDEYERAGRMHSDGSSPNVWWSDPEADVQARHDDLGAQILPFTASNEQ